MPLTRDIPRSEALRYLGMGKSVTADPDTLALLDSCAKTLARESVPRSICKEVSITATDSEVVIEDTKISSTGLARNLKCCEKAVLLAVTIGPACDRLVKRAQVRSNLEGAIYQALGAAAVEDYIDQINEKIRTDYEQEGLYARPRFSPGYGDLNLEHQKDWFRILDITKNTGITLLDSLLMVPTKSVTAIIGLASEPADGQGHNCEDCSMANTCSFSKRKEIT